MMTKHDTRTLHNLYKSKLATVTVNTGSTQPLRSFHF